MLDQWFPTFLFHRPFKKKKTTFTFANDRLVLQHLELLIVFILKWQVTSADHLVMLRRLLLVNGQQVRGPCARNQCREQVIRRQLCVTKLLALSDITVGSLFITSKLIATPPTQTQLGWHCLVSALEVSANNIHRGDGGGGGRVAYLPSGVSLKTGEGD